MGRGDKKTKRGKISRGSFGIRRPRIKKKVRPELKFDIDKDPTVKH
ncbi:30S ribosomal protein THX [Formosa sp. L2A11]|nr:30S ribosomal protein THX [Formosa sp. L2A11]